MVVFAPGPAALVVVAQGMAKGFKHSYSATLGIGFANVIYFSLSATGIAALIISSSFLFNLIKWCGIAYLLYLGLSAVFGRAGGITLSVQESQQTVKGGRAFLQGLVVELSNPKALLYFVALLPQFVDSTLPLIPQMLIFGMTTLCLDLISYGVYGYLGSSAKRFSAKPGFVKTINRLGGGLLIFAGIKMANAAEV